MASGENGHLWGGSGGEERTDRPTEQLRETTMGLLLIDEQGAEVRRERERFVVSSGAIELATVRISDVDAIVLCGRIETTAGALDLAMSRKIPVSFLTSDGRYRGTLLPLCEPGARLRPTTFVKPE